MKHMHRILALVLAVFLLLSMSVTAFAAETTTTYSIIVDNVVNGQTYSAYKIFDATYEPATTTGTTAKYSYTLPINSPWLDGIKAYMGNPTPDANGKLEGNSLTLTRRSDGTMYIVDFTASSFKPEQFAKALMENKPTTVNADASATVSGTTSVTLTVTGAGYYLVDTTVGTLCILHTAAPSIKVTEKNSAPKVVKLVNGVSENHEDIGDPMTFTITITAGGGAQGYIAEDTMDTGLSLVDPETVAGISDAFTVTVQRVAALVGEPDPAADTSAAVPLALGTDYTVEEGGTGKTFSFRISFTEVFCNTLTYGDEITITYQAKLNANANVGTTLDAGPGNKNSVVVKYGEQSLLTTTVSETLTRTWSIKLYKFTGSSDASTPLAGVGFKLYREVGTNAVKEYAVCADVDATPTAIHTISTWTDNAAAATVFYTPASGELEFKGLDALYLTTPHRDRYFIEEAYTPDGYNPLTGPIRASIQLDGKVDFAMYGGTSPIAAVNGRIPIQNQSGTALPSTGGIGTTIFYVVGGVLMLAAVVLLVTKKRMAAEN